MNPIKSLRASLRMLWYEPRIVLTLYLFASGLGTVARVPILITLGLIGWILSTRETFDSLAETVTQTQASIESSSMPNGEVIGLLRDAVETAVTPTILGITGVGVATAVGLFILFSALSSAVTIGGIHSLLRQQRPIEDSLHTMATHWRALLIVKLSFYLGVTLFVAVGFLIAANISGSVDQASPIAVAVAVSVGGVVSGVLILTWILLFAFAEQAVVIDKRTGLDAVLQSIKLPFQRPMIIVGYVGVALGAVVVAGVLAAIAALGGAIRILTLGTAIVLPAIVDGFKTSIYAERNFRSTYTLTLRRRFVETGRDGAQTLLRFVRSHPLANIASASVFAVGSLIGWSITAGIDTELPAETNIGSVFGSLPIGTFVNLSINNWLVAADLGLGGIIAGVPTITNLMFNGVVVGAVGGATTFAAFIALVAPHGIIELPAIAIGGGLGLWLGAVGVQALRGYYSISETANAIKYAFRVLLGLIPLFVIAGFIEAFLTPSIANVLIS